MGVLGSACFDIAIRLGAKNRLRNDSVSTLKLWELPVAGENEEPDMGTLVWGGIEGRVKPN